MESSENVLGPSLEQDLEAAQRSAEAMGSIAARLGAQEAPTQPAAPTKIEREDLLEYKLLGSRAREAELQITMYTRELQRSQAEANTVAHEGNEFLARLGAKYSLDIRLYTVTEDGYLVPRPTRVGR